MPTKNDITLLLRRIDDGEREALEELMRVVYGDLERMAASHLRRQFGERAGQVTLEPAALVNESFMRLIKQRKGFDNRGQFFAIATKVMLRVLLDYSRRRASRSERAVMEPRMTFAMEKADAGAGGGGAGSGAAGGGLVDVEALSRALERLEALDARKADIVKMRVIWGMTLEEVAEALEISRATVERDWRFAKAWLAEQIEGGGRGE